MRPPRLVSYIRLLIAASKAVSNQQNKSSLIQQERAKEPANTPEFIVVDTQGARPPLQIFP
jgi:hypothetical protein